ncbi:hypothetical protein CFP65_0326 [Kitasatospora sp. MMS16-BH015]|uniref:hypothetical protein n=1 Tax=Kitasatospora sp. MMS16-BH015 TaxID=2018025 RepID=UPI000CA1833F|nr:hypothetical protein [Kitasatospora sp. MMS16-BH015]AUG75300.1 hypothetical protein CFP65_0326 [Kitasatospora sp. MMS16-BH015]
MARPVRWLGVISATVLLLGAAVAAPATTADRPGPIGWFAYAPLPAPGAGVPGPAPQSR